MENFETNNTPDNRLIKQHHQSFAKQLSDWYSNGKAPELASQDTRFTLELQKQKLQSLGLDMQIQFKKPDTDDEGVVSLYYGDSIFVNSIICGSEHITTNIRNSQNELFSSNAEGGLTIVIQDPKEGGVPSPDTAMCCPNCGAPSTLGKLESGCEFCNTKFLMDELYPKVMHFFIEENDKKLFDTTQLKKYIVRCSIFFIVISIVIIIINMCSGQLEPSRLLNDIAGRIVASIMLGAIIGASVWFIANSISSVKQMGKFTRGAAKTGKSLLFCHKMHTLDPTFSAEYFRDKSMSLLKFMLYSQNPQELTICQCNKPLPEKLREIVDIPHVKINNYDKHIITYFISNIKAKTKTHKMLTSCSQSI